MRTPLRYDKRAAMLLLIGGLVVVGCNVVLDLDEFSTDGCPAPGTKRCIDDKTLQVCQVNGTWATEPECIRVCTTDGCDPCNEPGKVECDEATNSVLTCEPYYQWSAKKCVDQTCFTDACIGICAPGSRCQDALHIETCINGIWLEGATCTSAAQCIDGECRDCKAGEFRCNGSIVETCVASSWFSTADCDKIGEWGSNCKDAQCVGSCAAGRKRCTGSVLETCSDDGQWQGVDCTTQYRTCDDTTGTCMGECAATNPAMCAGNVLTSCNDKGQWVYEDCGPTRTCFAEKCNPTCGPASAQCNGDMTEVCTLQGTWTSVSPSACTNGCVDGMCTRSTCDCGPNQGPDCCASPFVPGGLFRRGNAPNALATIGAFRLDAYEITVGRFRKFVSMYNPVSLQDGSGSNPHVAGSGWKAAWNAYLPANADELKTNLACHSSSTWTNTEGSNENRPLNCLSWYEAFAFCIWEGGFLPTETEWNFAAAGGEEQREFPWSVPAKNTTIEIGHAVFQCLQPGSFNYNDCFLEQLPTVGSRSPLGDGKYGHKDLAGSLFEWTLDVYSPTYLIGNDCQDCANLNGLADAARVLRGGGWNGTASMLYTHARAQLAPTERQWFVGARCARGL